MNKEFIAGKTYIQVASQSYDEKEIEAMRKVVDSGVLVGGAPMREFESTLPKHFGLNQPAVMVNSGSSANLVAISSLSSPQMNQAYGCIEKWGEVITVAASFPTTVNPIFQNSWVPVFVDVNPRTLNADIETIQSARTHRTRAVVLAHTLGNPYRSDLLAEWCKKERLYLIEDCCDAFGSTIQGRSVGSFGDYATLSFYPAHHVSTGEGGAVLSKTPHLRKVAASFRDWGRDCWCIPGKDNTCGKRFEWEWNQLPKGYDHKYTYTNIGYNLKATDVQAAAGIAQLDKVSSFVEKRKQNWALLNEGVSHIKGIRAVEATPETDPSWFGFPMECVSVSRSKLIQHLEKHKIGTRLVFSGNIIRQPAYKHSDFRIHGDLKATDLIMDNFFWIGVHPNLTKEMIAYMLQVLEDGVKLCPL